MASYHVRVRLAVLFHDPKVDLVLYIGGHCIYVVELFQECSSYSRQILELFQGHSSYFEQFVRLLWAIPCAILGSTLCAILGIALLGPGYFGISLLGRRSTSSFEIGERVCFLGQFLMVFIHLR